MEGIRLGDVVGNRVGCANSLVGVAVVGNFDGAGVGISEGFAVGDELGIADGADEGLDVVGIFVGLRVGLVDGLERGGELGIKEG